MSTRPVATSMRGVNIAVTPPWRMKVPSCTVRTRSTAGLNVIVSVNVDSRDAFETERGTVYGPPATRNSCGAVTPIWAAAAAPGAAGGVVGGAVTSRGGGVVCGGSVVTGGTVGAGTGGGGTAPAGAAGAAVAGGVVV